GSCCTAFAQKANYVAAHFCKVDTEIFQNTRSDTFAFSNQAEKQVLRAYVIVSQLSRFVPGKLQHSLGARRKRYFYRHESRPAANYLLDFDARIFQIYAHRLESLGSDASSFAN